jgi:hypothetical protein
MNSLINFLTWFVMWAFACSLICCFVYEATKQGKKYENTYWMEKLKNEN